MKYEVFKKESFDNYQNIKEHIKEKFHNMI
jgi:hypothetical protein